MPGQVGSLQGRDKVGVAGEIGVGGSITMIHNYHLHKVFTCRIQLQHVLALTDATSTPGLYAIRARLACIL